MTQSGTAQAKQGQMRRVTAAGSRLASAARIAAPIAAVDIQPYQYIEGPAVAGGMELGLWCDFRVMAQGSCFGVYCRRWGVPLIDGGTVRLPRIVGQGRALEIILTGRKVPAEECLTSGLCEYVTPKGGARAKAEELAREIARFPQVCVRADRRSAIRSHGLGVREALIQEWYNGREALIADGVAGAARFKAGLGRHGDFDKIR